tara:strand:- start:6464 stop:9292 length:2829 start_codon:yes stop_codon:yes gene_type:complete
MERSSYSGAAGQSAAANIQTALTAPKLTHDAMTPSMVSYRLLKEDLQFRSKHNTVLAQEMDLAMKMGAHNSLAKKAALNDAYTLEASEAITQFSTILAGGVGSENDAVQELYKTNSRLAHNPIFQKKLNHLLTAFEDNSERGRRQLEEKSLQNQYNIAQNNPWHIYNASAMAAGLRPVTPDMRGKLEAAGDSMGWVSEANYDLLMEHGVSAGTFNFLDDDDMLEEVALQFNKRSDEKMTGADVAREIGALVDPDVARRAAGPADDAEAIAARKQISRAKFFIRRGAALDQHKYGEQIARAEIRAKQEETQSVVSPLWNTHWEALTKSAYDEKGNPLTGDAYYTRLMVELGKFTAMMAVKTNRPLASTLAKTNSRQTADQKSKARLAYMKNALLNSGKYTQDTLSKYTEGQLSEAGALEGLWIDDLSFPQKNPYEGANTIDSTKGLQKAGKVWMKRWLMVRWPTALEVEEKKEGKTEGKTEGKLGGVVDYNKSTVAGAKKYGKRPDGSLKGKGYLGELKLPNGGVATEFSTQSDAVKVDGQRIDFPSLVPTLTDEEKQLMADDIIPNGKDIPDEIMQKAVDHAINRLAEGQDVFYNQDDLSEQEGAAIEGEGARSSLVDKHIDSEELARVEADKAKETKTLAAGEAMRKNTLPRQGGHTEGQTMYQGMANAWGGQGGWGGRSAWYQGSATESADKAKADSDSKPAEGATNRSAMNRARGGRGLLPPTGGKSAAELKEYREEAPTDETGKFDPNSKDYDDATAADAGLERDETGHMGSLDPRTGMVLKGRLHPTWDKMYWAEKDLGNTVVKATDGRYYSRGGGKLEPGDQVVDVPKKVPTVPKSAKRNTPITNIRKSPEKKTVKDKPHPLDKVKTMPFDATIDILDLPADIILEFKDWDDLTNSGADSYTRHGDWGPIKVGGKFYEYKRGQGYVEYDPEAVAKK